MKETESETEATEGDKEQLATPAALLAMATRLRKCAEGCEHAAEFLKANNLSSFPEVSVKTSRKRVGQIQGFVRRLKMRKEKREEAVQEMGEEYESLRGKKED